LSTAGELDTAKYERLTEKVMVEFPEMLDLAVTLRESRSADQNGWSACMRDQQGLRVSKRYEIAQNWSRHTHNKKGLSLRDLLIDRTNCTCLENRGGQAIPDPANYSVFTVAFDVAIFRRA
jgi:hypothetical protein